MHSPAHEIAFYNEITYNQQSGYIIAECTMTNQSKKTFRVFIDPLRCEEVTHTESGRKAPMPTYSRDRAARDIYKKSLALNYIPSTDVRKSNHVLRAIKSTVFWNRNAVDKFKNQLDAATTDPLDVMLGSDRAYKAAAEMWAARRTAIIYVTHGAEQAEEVLENELYWLNDNAIRDNSSSMAYNLATKLKAMALRDCLKTFKNAVKEVEVW